MKHPNAIYKIRFDNKLIGYCRNDERRDIIHQFLEEKGVTIPELRPMQLRQDIVQQEDDGTYELMHPKEPEPVEEYEEERMPAHDMEDFEGERLIDLIHPKPGIPNFNPERLMQLVEELEAEGIEEPSVIGPPMNEEDMEEMMARLDHDMLEEMVMGEPEEDPRQQEREQKLAEEAKKHEAKLNKLGKLLK